MNFDMIAPHSAWHVLTRLGEIQILIPAALLVAFHMLRQRDARVAGVAWLGGLCAAALITTLSKVAFIGWGVGYAPLNFTGISGHSMFAAAVYPMLMGTMAPVSNVRARHAAIGAGCVLAVVVGISRIAVGAHSPSEVIAGLTLGASVSLYCVTRYVHTLVRMSPGIPILIALWLAWSPLQTPPLPTHSVVTRLSLSLSGHPTPFTRSEMLRNYYKAQQGT
jgi:membrane-associated phospholipid phosphatase